ncbi:hypothetical protein J7M02_02665, partial [Candidatus Aerophobetes bacterium]|nr:hypothetical protein [Candidatus Aerophobetes bacterium]
MYKFVAALDPEGRRILSWLLPSLGDNDLVLQFYKNPHDAFTLDFKAVYLVETTLYVYAEVTINNLRYANEITNIEFLTINPPANFKTVKVEQVSKIDEDIQKRGAKVKVGFIIEGLDESHYEMKREIVYSQMPVPTTTKPIPDIPAPSTLPDKENPLEEEPLPPYTTKPTPSPHGGESEKKHWW